MITQELRTDSGEIPRCICYGIRRN